MLVKREVSDQPFQPAIFFFHLPETPQLAHAEVRVLLLPGVEGGVTHPELSGEVADRGAAFSLADGIDDLLFREFRPLHRSTPFVEDRQSRHRTLVLICRRFRGRRQPRSHVMSVLGYPKSTEVVNGERTEMYEYVNGSEGASKVRILLYAAGDLFTLCLTELIFWPAELAFGQGTDERAVAIYGQDDKARQIRITKKDGTVIADRQKPGIAEPAAIGTIGQSARTDQNLSESDFKRLAQQLFVGLADQKFLRLAVLPTEHISGSGSKTFSNYMTEKLTYGIYEAKVGKLVERARLIKVMEELQLSHEARFEERTAKRIGLMSGADIVVISSFVEIGSKIVEVNAKAVSVETGEIVGVGTMKFPAEIISKLMY